MGKKIVLTGGGSGGHVVPNLALIPYLQEKGYEVHYIGTEDGIEKQLVTDVPYHSIRAGKLRRYLSKENIKDIFKTFKGISDAKKVLKQIQPCHRIFLFQHRKISIFCLLWVCIICLQVPEYSLIHAKQPGF